MGPSINRELRYIAALIFLTLHVTSSAKTQKTNARPVYEVINESKADDRQIKTGQTDLPYGNPLAGNSHTNALLHAHNQQAMFNAERVRQHKAQLQRWTKTPLIDSYMRAYHESQENHQLALEQQQSKVEEKKQAPRQREPTKKSKQLDPVALSKEEGGRERTRNHRSFGSAAYQHIAPRYHTLYFPSAYNNSPMKPNVVNEMVHSPASKLYTGIAVNSEGSFPKYYPAQDYTSVQNIETLNSLLNKNPGDQLTEFNALINSAKANSNHDKELEMPIDLYFYLKDPSSKGSEHYAHISNVRDHTPIKEEVDEGDDSKMLGFREHSNVHTSQLDPKASKNIQFINSELTSQILSTGYNPLFQEENAKEEVEPEHQLLQYGQQETNNQDVDFTDGDLSERYLHHNGGIQHLNDDGVGVSAYDEENVSRYINSIDNRKHSRSKRSTIDTEKSVSIGNHSMEDTETNVTQVPKAEQLVRIRLVPKYKRFSEFGTFLTTPNFAIGEAVDHNEGYPLAKTRSRNYGATEIFNDEHDYENYDDFAADYDYEIFDTIPQRNHYIDTFENYAPSESYIHNVKFNSKFPNQSPIKRIPNLNSAYGPPPSSSAFSSSYSPSIRSVYSSDLSIPSTYGSPNPTSTYGAPQSFSHNVDTAFNPSSSHLPEPVYLLTQTQLAKLVGHHNLNIEHLDVYQLSKSKRHNHYPRKYKKRSPHRSKQFKKNILKLHNLHII